PHSCVSYNFMFNFFFFFQAEDGIRDRNVTEFRRVLFRSSSAKEKVEASHSEFKEALYNLKKVKSTKQEEEIEITHEYRHAINGRSEERRVGKECRSRWATYHEKKKRVQGRRERARKGETR